MGRPNSYEIKIKPRLSEIAIWAQNGLIDEEIASNLNVAMSTFYEHKKKYVEFSEALKNKEKAIERTANALFKTAEGFKVTLKRPFKTKNIKYDNNGKKISETEEIIYADYEEYIPPNVAAQCFWLKNRRPDLWRDKQDVDIQGGVNIFLKPTDEFK